MAHEHPSHEPTPEQAAPDQQQGAKEREAERERYELLYHVQAVLEPVMAALGLVFLGLLLLDFAEAELGFLDDGRIDRTLNVIWAVFVFDFGLRFFIAPAKVSFLRANLLTAVSLVLPFLRPLRAFRAIRAVRSLSLVRLLGGINRGMRVLRQVVRGRQFAYVAVMTVIVALAGAAGALFFERGFAGSPIRSFGDALWWSSSLVTTINNEKYVVSPEGRVLGILLRVYALSVFGYITASIASYLIGTAGQAEDTQGESEALRAEVAALREEIAALRRELADVGSARRQPANTAASDD